MDKCCYCRSSNMVIYKLHLFTSQITGKNILNSQSCWDKFGWRRHETKSEKSIQDRVKANADVRIHDSEGDVHSFCVCSVYYMCYYCEELSSVWIQIWTIPGEQTIIKWQTKTSNRFWRWRWVLQCLLE